MTSYLQIVLSLLAFASSHQAEFKSIWESVVKLYLATREAIDNIKRDLPAVESDAGTLAFTMATAEELDAEERLEAIIAPAGSLSFKMGGSNLRSIVSWLMTTNIGKSLLKEILAKIGS